MIISKHKEVVTFIHIRVELSCGIIIDIPIDNDDEYNEQFVIDHLANNIVEISYVDIDGVCEIDVYRRGNPTYINSRWFTATASNTVRDIMKNNNEGSCVSIALYGVENKDVIKQILNEII